MVSLIFGNLFPKYLNLPAPKRGPIRVPCPEGAPLHLVWPCQRVHTRQKATSQPSINARDHEGVQCIGAADQAILVDPPLVGFAPSPQHHPKVRMERVQRDTKRHQQDNRTKAFADSEVKTPPCQIEGNDRAHYTPERTAHKHRAAAIVASGIRGPSGPSCGPVSPLVIGVST